MLEVVARDARLRRTRTEQGGIIPGGGYALPGALLFRGTAEVRGDSAAFAFTVPVSLRGGPDAKIRAYAWGEDWDALGALVPLPVRLQSSVSTDTTGPTILFSRAGGTVSGGEEIEVTLEDPAGINLTRVFDFLAVTLKVFDASGLEQLREDLTERFQYDLGSHTRGTLHFPVPDLPTGTYTFLVIATDNYNNRSQESVEFHLVGRGTRLAITDVVPYPNPFRPEPGGGGGTRVLFTLNRPASVAVRIYAVSGRRVWETRLDADAGRNSVAWDGRDEAGDPVANGVYLVRLAARGIDGGGTAQHLERLVVLR